MLPNQLHKQNTLSMVNQNTIRTMFLIKAMIRMFFRTFIQDYTHQNLNMKLFK